MQETKKKHAGGAPKKEIDWELFEQLCELQCTQAEMASVLKINVDTLHDRAQEKYKESYSEIYKKFSLPGKCSLRRNQFNLSKTNATLAIWLGKQWLGQKDNEILSSIPPLQNEIDKDHLIMKLSHEIAKMKEGAKECP